MKGGKAIGLLLALTYAVNTTASGWRLKPKVLQQSPDLEITTPDGQQILVGEDKMDVLLYEQGFNNWSTKTK